MKRGLLTWPAIKQDMRTTVSTFLVGGPLLYAPVWFLLGWSVDNIGAQLFLLPLFAPTGFAAWWNWALQPRMALLTWIPTLVAGFACGYSMRYLAISEWYQQTARVLKLMVAATVCGVISALIYETTFKISKLIGAVPFPETNYLPAHAGGVPVVGVVGFILGAYLFWQATRRPKEAA